MRKVNIIQISQPDRQSVFSERKKYSIALGNDLKASFSNAKKAAKKLTEVNRILNNSLFDLNILLSEVFNEYRRAWFVLPDNLDNNISSILKAFRLSVVNSYNNGNFYPFLHINSICMDLLLICEKLKIYYSSVKEFNSLGAVKSFEKRINFIIDQVNQAGK